MKNNKALGIAVICIVLLVSLSLVSSLIDATPDSFNMYVTVDEEGSDVALKVYLAGREGPLSEATVEYELFTAEGVPLGVEGEMEKVALGVWCSSALPLAGNLGEVCALVQANRRGYPPQERRYYFPVAASMTSAADGLSNPGLGMMAIRQEFVWDDASGTFQTVNIYTIGYVEDIIADMEQVLTSGAPGDGLILGRDCGLPYYYWQDSASWHTLANRTRYKGYDIRAEATATRGDNIFTQGCADGYDRVASYEAWASVVLANDWEIDVTQEYTQWGHEVKLTAPDGIRYSTVWGDPHLLQKGGTEQQELAAVGHYVFALGPDFDTADYKLDLSCMKMNAGFSLVTALNITGPDNYLLTMGRNGEIKISGGSGGGNPQARPSLPGEPEIEFIEAPSDGATLYGSEVTIRVEANECLQNATLHFGGDSYPMTDMDVGKELRWEKTLSGFDFDTYSFYVTGTDLDGDSGSSSERQVTLQAVPPVGGEAYPVNKLAVLAPWIVLAVLLVSGMSWFMLMRRRA